MPKVGGIMAPKTPTGGVSSLTAVKFNDGGGGLSLCSSPSSSFVRDRCESM